MPYAIYIYTSNYHCCIVFNNQSIRECLRLEISEWLVLLILIIPAFTWFCDIKKLHSMTCFVIFMLYWIHIVLLPATMCTLKHTDNISFKKNKQSKNVSFLCIFLAVVHMNNADCADTVIAPRFHSVYRHLSQLLHFYISYFWIKNNLRNWF